MQRSIAAVPLTCLALLSACLWLADGCANAPTTPLTATPGTTTTGSTTPVITSSCTGTCTPYIALDRWSAGLKPGASVTFSAIAFNLRDATVTWTVEEGSSGGSITDAGVYTAPLTEGVYHVTATAKADSALRQTVAITVTVTEFTVGGTTSVDRWYHTASLLPGGQVFIAGGMNDDYDFADPAELYDPATGTFHLAGKVSRISHSATVLGNGDVLLAGGMFTNTADLFKAGSGVIQPTGSMATGRYNHSATLLHDGRVLIAGGANIDTGKAMQKAELYDPASGKFTPAGDMTTPRMNHSAVLLPNGRVLIVGGGADAELYDPAANSFLPAPGVSANRCLASATPLANGRVLIAGGADCSNNALDTAEIYDPSTGQSTPTGKLVAAQAQATATLLPDGRVMLVGGGVENLSQFYDPVTGSFTLGPHLIYPRFAHTATLLSDGSLLIVGSVLPAELYK